MTLKEVQKEIDVWMNQFKVPYWKPHEILARLTEEVGEVAREVNCANGPKKKKADEKILINQRLLENESFFDQLMRKTVIEGFDSTKVKLDPKSAQFINTCLVKEYLNEYHGNHAW